ncbi:hypothetical protein CCP2SC5_970001 [Azospirillaceae bacterium]
MGPGTVFPVAQDHKEGFFALGPNDWEHSPWPHLVLTLCLYFFLCLFVPLETPIVSLSPLLNNRLSRLSDYPFTRLANLLAEFSPPTGVKQIMLSLGEPQHTPPALIDEALRVNAHLWGKYPPVAGTPEFRAAAGDWLTRRYGLPKGAFDPEVSLLPVAGTREALFMAAQLVTPERKAGQTPVVLMPNPFYAVYQGAGLIAGAEPMLLSATATTGFLPDLETLSPSVLERTSLFYLCSPANPQGSAANLEYLRRALVLARRYGFVLAVDECYSEIYVSNRPPKGALQAALSLSGGNDNQGLWSNLLVFHSLSKRSSAAGLRSGFVGGGPGPCLGVAGVGGGGDGGGGGSGFILRRRDKNRFWPRRRHNGVNTVGSLLVGRSQQPSPETPGTAGN